MNEILAMARLPHDVEHRSAVEEAFVARHPVGSDPTVG